MNLSALKRSSIIYLIPYLLLLILGAWYRYHIWGMIYLEDDSDHYLVPAVRKAFTGEWHKGERPMQYLLFVYYTLSERLGIQYTVLLQQILGLVSAAFLALAWNKFLSAYRRLQWLWHLLGYMMVGIYISSPAIMYYEQLLAPESFCIFVMSALICCLTYIYSNKDSEKISGPLNRISQPPLFISLALFINLYLANPMTKWIFACLFLELVLLYTLIKQPAITRRKKIVALIIPHVLYLLLVWLPEYTHHADLPNEDRVYIEYEQMVYSHFNLLAQDKTNFGLTPALQDSMMQYFKDAERPDFLLKFSNDDLMWGKASERVAQYYNYNYNDIKNYYFALTLKLATKYPIGLTRETGRQLSAFYIPNHTIHKDLFNCVDFTFSYNQNARIITRLKHAITDCANLPVHDDWKQTANPANAKAGYQIIPNYPSSLLLAEAYNIHNQPLLFNQGFWFYRFFSPLFLALLLSFLGIRFYQRKAFQLNLISLLFTLIFIYVLTIAIVHTFDCTRFVITIYPFLLISTCMALVFIVDFCVSKTISK